MKKRYWFLRKDFRMQELRSFLYRGFRITVYNNRLPGFRYEYKCQPISQSARHLSNNKVLHDSSSTGSIRRCMHYAKIDVDAMYQPFYGVHGYYEYMTKTEGAKFFLSDGEQELPN